MNPLRKISLLLLLLATLPLAACKSYWIEASVINHTGQSIRELEVTYPSATFGTNGLVNGEVMHYRFQVRGTGPVKVEYVRTDGKSVHASGLTLGEHQQGSVTILLLPDGKAEFQTGLQP